MFFLMCAFVIEEIKPHVFLLITKIIFTNGVQSSKIFLESIEQMSTFYPPRVHTPLEKFQLASQRKQTHFLRQYYSLSDRFHKISTFFFKSLKCQVPEIQNHFSLSFLHALSVFFLDCILVLLFLLHLNEQEVSIHLSQCSWKFMLFLAQNILQNSCRNPAEDWYMTHNVILAEDRRGQFAFIKFLEEVFLLLFIIKCRLCHIASDWTTFKT